MDILNLNLLYEQAFQKLRFLYQPYEEKENYIIVLRLLAAVNVTQNILMPVHSESEKNYQEMRKRTAMACGHFPNYNGFPSYNTLPSVDPTALYQTYPVDIPPLYPTPYRTDYNINQTYLTDSEYNKFSRYNPNYSIGSGYNSLPNYNPNYSIGSGYNAIPSFRRIPINPNFPIKTEVVGPDADRYIKPIYGVRPTNDMMTFYWNQPFWKLPFWKTNMESTEFLYGTNRQPYESYNDRLGNRYYRGIRYFTPDAEECKGNAQTLGLTNFRSVFIGFVEWVDGLTRYNSFQGTNNFREAISFMPAKYLLIQNLADLDKTDVRLIYDYLCALYPKDYLKDKIPDDVYKNWETLWNDKYIDSNQKYAKMAEFTENSGNQSDRIFRYTVLTIMSENQKDYKAKLQLYLDKVSKSKNQNYVDIATKAYKIT